MRKMIEEAPRTMQWTEKDAEAMAAWRAERGISQEGLARLMGVSWATVNRMERKARRVKITTVAAWERVRDAV